MKPKTIKFFAVVLLISFTPFFSCPLVSAQEEGEPAREDYEVAQATVVAPVSEQPKEMPEEVITAPGNVTLDFKDADIHNVLRILSYKSGVNIVAGKEVAGTVTIRLTDVPWEKALEVILKTMDLGHERDGNIISVTTLAKLTELRKAKKELAEIEPLVTKVFTLKYIDATDAAKVLEKQVSPQGKVTALETTGQKGWAFGVGAKALEKRARVAGQTTARSKTLIVTDVASSVEKIEKVLAEIDVMPQLVMIETKIMEVSRDVLKDIGLDWGTGTAGAESATGYSAVNLDEKGGGKVKRKITSHDLGSVATSAVFGAKSTDMTLANTGLRLLFQKMTGNQFEVILHALEENINVNTLSAPRVMTLNNQEATILVGTKFPILETQTTGAGGTAERTTTLKEYMDIGIQLNVVPQISADDYINMIVHPAVTSITSYETAKSSSGETLARYPVIDAREAETQLLIKDGETIVIGGLYKDRKSKGYHSVPVLGDIPLLGLLFRRQTDDVEKIDLLIFITAHIIRPGELTEEELAQTPSGIRIQLEEKAIEALETKKKKR